MRLNVGCGTWYIDGWTNTDTNPGAHKCDVAVTAADPFPMTKFPDNSADQVYLGHVLEHVPWHTLYDWSRGGASSSGPVASLGVADFLREARRVLKPDGQLLAVGPDVYRTIRRWGQGIEPWEMIESVLEHVDRDDHDGHLIGGAHAWNCHEERLLTKMRANGFPDARPVDGALIDDHEWPVIGWAPWQCAVFGC